MAKLYSQPRRFQRIDFGNPVSAKLSAVFAAIADQPLVNPARPSQVLTAFGTPTYPRDAVREQYIQLNGTSQYLRNSAFTQSGNTYPLTLACWFYCDLLPAANCTMMALSASGGTSCIFQLYVNNIGCLTSRQYNTSSTISSGALTTGKWYFATAVFENASSRKLYLDGVLQGTDTVTATAPSGMNQLDIGGSPWAGPGEFFPGRIATPMTINLALSVSQIQSMRANTWQIFKPVQQLFAAASGSLNAAASGSDTAAGSASLTALIAMAGVGVSVASGSAGASVAVPLSAAGISVAGGAATGQATVTISAGGLAHAAGTAGLSASVLLSAAGAAQASGNAVLAAQLNALASGAAQSSGSANLSGGAPGSLAAAGGDVAGGSAVLSVTVQLVATGADQASGSAAGITSAPGAISASGQAQAGGSATWSSLVTLTAAGFVQAMGAGFTAITVPLSAIGQAVTTGHATGSLLGLVKNYRLTSTIERLTPLSAKVARCTQLSTALARLTTLHHEVSHGV